MPNTLPSLLLMIVTLIAMSGCAQVKPWERGNLSKDIMAWEIDPLKSSLDSHIYFSKEGSSGGGQSAGGGCGCN
ncbi:DUF4266 domain-containing protein [Bacterioplanoides sp. SCSIO 12839]|uniref:DUF4266 domain-containing protein n=1 Tax=Bacterioplanoides sp. SCSIO 12839 TaxID=2829569 RepID=UPI002103EC26|nr:DUF4266 domain-containing protein [Bacterioplanoides sp. SCSIO 12839]UTW46848.1 DUF4266 domain-containing protein [Bacterioplanoides sp. SCSIO 12839]